MEESIETINQTACEERKLQKGEKNVYMDWDIVENADLNSFQVLNCVFSKDKSNVYFYNYYMGKLQILKWADPKTFQILNSHYVKDDNYVWIVWWSGDIVWKHYLVENINVKSFVALGDSRYAKDKNYVYRQEKLLDFVDVKTFEEVGWGYIKDKNWVYFWDIPFQRWDILEWVDIKTFEVFSDSWYAKDKNHVYQWKELLDFVDVKTFEEVGWNYIKDKNWVYFWSSSLRIWETLEWVDIKNFDYEEYEENKSKIRIEKGVELGEKIEEFRKKFEEKFKACGETDECIIKLQKEFEENEEYKELEREFKEFYWF
jgi:hypothetical protein